jgi:hypothetical protein
MDPRTLIAPTVTVFLIIVFVCAGLYYAGDTGPADEQEGEEVNLHSRSEVKSFLAAKFAAESKKTLIVYGMIAALIYFCPVNLTDGMSNRILKLMIGGFTILVSNLMSGRLEVNGEIVMRVSMLGGLLLGIVLIVRTIKRMQPQDKRPCHMRWSSRNQLMETDTDAETLAKLDRWRDIASGTVPAALPGPRYEA